MRKSLTYTRLTRLSRLVLVPVLLLMLVVGFQQKGHDSSNLLHYNSHERGYSFTRNSIAFTDMGVPFPGRAESFTIELVIQPDYMAYPSFQFILLAYGKSDDDQLLVGQWDRSLVVMNGADYSNREHEPKLYVPLGVEGGKKHVRITSDTTGAVVYVDGRLVRQSSDVVLRFPGRRDSRLVLGNSISARNPWFGTLYDLRIYDSGNSANSLHYDFTRNVVGEIGEEAGRGPAIQLPAKIPVLHKRILLWPDFDVVSRPWMVFDIVINIIGFVPIGILLPLSLHGARVADGRFPFLLSFSLVVGLSLGIEIGQIFLPSRHSSLLDLVLNALGGLVGIFIALHCTRQQRLA